MSKELTNIDIVIQNEPDRALPINYNPPKRERNRSCYAYDSLDVQNAAVSFLFVIESNL